MTVSSLRRSDASMPMTANGSTTMPVSTAHGSHWAASRMGAELNMRTAIPTETITKIARSTTRAMEWSSFGGEVKQGCARQTSMIHPDTIPP